MTDPAVEPVVDVVVWVSPVESTLSDSVRDLLTAEELERAQRPGRTARGRAFALGRALSRLAVARQAGVDPHEVGFEVGPTGKPRIVASEASPGPTVSGVVAGGAGALAGWEHSVSHSGEVVVVAVAHGAPVGVDVELLSEDRPFLRLADRFFDPDEAARLAELPAGRLRAEFLRLWTRKEAVLKALGSGLSGRLDSVVPVPSAAPASPDSLTPSTVSRPDLPDGQHAGDGGERGTPAFRDGRWSVIRDGESFEGVDLEVGSGHVAAVAVAGNLGSLEVRNLDGVDDLRGDPGGAPGEFLGPNR